MLASVKSLNAAANSGDYSNLILDKLQEKWAEDQAAVACVWQEQSVLSSWGKKDATCLAPVHFLAPNL